MAKPGRQTRALVEPIKVPTGVITGIDGSARAAGRFDIAIDKKFAARMGIGSIERLKLKVGIDVDARFAASIAEEAMISRAYDRAMKMLALRGRASGELRRRLVQKGELPPYVDAAIGRLREAGFIDDGAFARGFARAKGTGGVSRRRIQQELGKKGVDWSTAVDAVDETFEEEGIDEAESIERAAEKKLRTLTRVDDETRQRRLYGYLARRGFDADDIREIVRRVAKSGE
jgi:regulatory protein